jgi:hypothetical protein
MNASESNNQKSFECFIGKWEGLSKTFDEQGNFLESSPVHMEIEWINSETFRQLEHIKNLYQVGEVTLRSEIKVNGKTAFAKTDHLHLQATELTSGTFLFRVESGVSHTTLHNTHHFIDKNNRRVITHKLKEGKTFVFQVQDFTRID